MSSEPIEEYLDELMRACRALPARRARYLVSEAEAHLRDAAEASSAAGVAAEQAERDAVRAFGSVDDLVTGERSGLRVPRRVLAAQIARSGFVLGAVGAVAVGVSGVLAGAIYLIGGAGAVASTPTPADLTAANCARWLQSGGHDCRGAALTDWASEIVGSRIVLGLLGAAALIGFRALARRRGWRSGLDPMVSESIATTLFAGGALWTLGMGVDSAVHSTGGVGQWFSAAAVAAVAALISGWRLGMRLRTPTLL